MSPGPLARIFAQAAVLGISILSRALPAAYAQAVQNAKKGGTSAAAAAVRNSMRREEALQILNLSETEATPEAIRRVS